MKEEFYRGSPDDLEVSCDVYHVDGTITHDINESGPDVCAKKVVYYQIFTVRWYVKRYGGEFYDPSHISPVYKKYPWKLGPVSEAAFEMYLQFLGFKDAECKGKSYLKKRAERLV